MAAKKDLKKRIRARQAKTGESYTTARAHVLRAREDRGDERTAGEQRVTAVVLKCNESSLRVRVKGEDSTVTLRISSHEAATIVPGQLVEAKLGKRWSWRNDAYATGSIERTWIDVPALGLEPIALKELGDWTPSETVDPFVPPDPYAPMWELFATSPRRAFEFEGTAWGVGVGCDPDDPDACLVADAAEIADQDPVGARSLLMDALLSDLRCIDAHVHLGNLIFEGNPATALTHYEIGIAIGDLTLGPDFDAVLPWGYIFNRPFLRALHGCGLCLWRLGRKAAAQEVFERALKLNPNDELGVRFCWGDVRKGGEWVPEGGQTRLGVDGQPLH